MLFKSAVVAGIKKGRVTLAFRRWTAARIKPGSEVRTALGVVGITGVEAVALTAITEADARKAGCETRDLLLAELKKTKAGTVYRIGLRYAGSDPRLALREKPMTKEDVADVALRLARLDKASKDGTWTKDVLLLIADHPAMRAGNLAAQLGWETQAFKIRVRKLKELGLTESLEIGYKLSPRGAAILKAAPRRPM
jgi:hypothetical protein